MKIPTQTGAGTSAAQKENLNEWLRLVQRDEDAAAFVMTLITPDDENDVILTEDDLPCLPICEHADAPEHEEDVEYVELLAAIAASEAPDEFEIEAAEIDALVAEGEALLEVDEEDPELGAMSPSEYEEHIDSCDVALGYDSDGVLIYE